MTRSQAWCPAYIGIGSNLDDPPARVRRAFDALRALPDCTAFAHSGLYRSAPMGPADQPDFINAVAACLTRLDARRLLHELQAMEYAQDRQRGAGHWGPRTLDLDLLVLGQVVMNEPDLVVPHPRIHERNFVLLPLAEIAPYLIVPGHGSVNSMVTAIAGSETRIARLEQGAQR
ncbi:MAG: 2-amino-4-hydroxy-6-hydroxymethyldihydropteridine diphosphokinase [Woeseia sp.]